MKHFLILLILLNLTSCEQLVKHRYGFFVKNNSNISISYYAEYTHPDTALPVNMPKLDVLKTGESGVISDNEVNDPEFKRLESGENLSIFVFATDTINRYTWDSIYKDYKVLKCIIYTKDMGGKVSYPQLSVECQTN